MKTVSHTLFFPLYGRAEASRRWPTLFPDPWALKAEEIGKAEGTPAESLGGFPAAIYGLRHLITVTEVKNYLKDHPGASVVNIGCGLDSLALDLQDHECTIYNLDFPSVFELRQRWLPQHPSEIALPFSCTDTAWMNEVDNSNGTIAIAPGVIYYLEIPEARNMIRAMAEHFPGGRFTYDCESPRVIKGSETMIAKKGTPCEMPFKLKDPLEPGTWSNKITNIEIEHNFANYLSAEQRKQLPIQYRLAFRSFGLIKGMYQVRMDFAK
ncbi:MAG: class I SAM-dependent methyltransferase [Corynebacterium sp.]|nr:class I SAM-dependent methyltransferase [Corynebacterium sp.]